MTVSPPARPAGWGSSPSGRHWGHARGGGGAGSRGHPDDVVCLGHHCRVVVDLSHGGQGEVILLHRPVVSVAMSKKLESHGLEGGWGGTLRDTVRVHVCAHVCAHVRVHVVTLCVFADRDPAVVGGVRPNALRHLQPDSVQALCSPRPAKSQC